MELSDPATEGVAYDTPSSKDDRSTVNGAVQSGAQLEGRFQQLQHTLNDHLDTHMTAFREEYTQSWRRFYSECIQPSVEFIGTEKKALDAKYATLHKQYTDAVQKCEDLERYNALLREKIEAVETEMKTFTQVSMITRWENKLAKKTRECEQTEEKLAREKRKVDGLRAENTFLNTQLERLSTAHVMTTQTTSNTLTPGIAAPPISDTIRKDDVARTLVDVVDAGDVRMGDDTTAEAPATEVGVSVEPAAVQCPAEAPEATVPVAEPGACKEDTPAVTAPVVAAPAVNQPIIDTQPNGISADKEIVAADETAPNECGACETCSRVYRE